MNRGDKPAFPVWALLLDIVGTLLLAIGIYGVVSAQLARSLAVALIIIGVFMMMPLVIVLVQRLSSR